MNLIEKELMLSKEKMIEEVPFQGKTLAKLTQNNVAIVEAMICNDSAYIHSSDKNACPRYNTKKEIVYGGSTAYWMNKLKMYLFENNNEIPYEKIIKGAVEAVDRDNSTHLNADRCGREEITNRIIQFGYLELIECLKNPDYDNMKLFREISKMTSASSRARENKSFASKFCHYACFYLFEGTENQDNYSIYDGILRETLPLYISFFNIETKYDLEDYAQYRSAVDAIRLKTEEPISRNGFDHLLWYYHKGRL